MNMEDEWKKNQNWNNRETERIARLRRMQRDTTALEDLQFLFRQDIRYNQTLENLTPELFKALQSKPHNSDSNRKKKENKKKQYLEDKLKQKKKLKKLKNKKAQTEHNYCFLNGLGVALSPRTEVRIRNIIDRDVKMLNLEIGKFLDKFKKKVIKPKQKLGGKQIFFLIFKTSFVLSSSNRFQNRIYRNVQ